MGGANGIMLPAHIAPAWRALCVHLEGFCRKEPVHLLQSHASIHCASCYKVHRSSDLRNCGRGCGCCSAEIDLEGIGMTPCAIKRLPWSRQYQRKVAEAELEAFFDTHDMQSVVTCLGVFQEVAADGHYFLQVAMQ